MITSIYVLATLICANVKVELVNMPRPLTVADRNQIAISSARCNELYTLSPCLVKLYKIADLRYAAVCGAPGAN
jgi:hypothetical protein